ncbi:MAG TPA: competence/damage-inducible protein A [Gemmatimonadales bacterium]|jgi:nicotinamide-nucleotide amidase
MRIELITIGNELLLGFTVDTNGAEIARALASVGVEVVRRTAVPDRAEDIGAAVADALDRTGAVLTTGGLGPTRDDVSKRAVADLYQAPLEFDDQVWSDIVQRFARAQRTPAASNRGQAEVPKGATVLRNRWGTAPGLWLEGGRGLTIMLPGVPTEMRKLLEAEVVPRLAARSTGAVVRSLLVRTTAIPESSLAERMGDIEREIAPLTLAYLPGIEGVDLRVTAWSMTPADAEPRLRSAAALIRDRAGEHAYGEGDADLAAVVLERARLAGLSLGVAESCTGGLVGGRLTDVPGSSDVFLGGVIGYSNRLKTELLDVPTRLIADHGAVSEQVARAMADGARARLGVNLAVSVTGIAGPSGGTEEKPVGTVWFAVASAVRTDSKRVIFFGSRREVRERAAQTALFLLLRRLLAD